MRPKAMYGSPDVQAGKRALAVGMSRVRLTDAARALRVFHVAASAAAAAAAAAAATVVVVSAAVPVVLLSEETRVSLPQ